jgi:hypothetical protein
MSKTCITFVSSNNNNKMKNTLIAFALMVSGSAMAQTNYNTIMNPKQRKQEINLHLNRAKTFEKIGNTLAIATIISAVASFHIYKGKENANAMIFIPLTIGGASLISFTIGDRQEMKAEELKEKR